MRSDPAADETPRSRSLIMGTVGATFAGTMVALVIVRTGDAALLEGYSRSLPSRLLAGSGWILGLPLLTYFPMVITIDYVLPVEIAFIDTALIWAGGTLCAVSYVWIWCHHATEVTAPSLRRRRLVKWGGIACALLTAPILVPVGVLYLAALSLAHAAAKAPIPEITFPAGFAGQAVLALQVPSAPRLEMEDGTWRFEFTDSGRLSFGNRGIVILRTPRYFERTPSGARVPLLPADNDACNAAAADSSAPRAAARSGVCWTIGALGRGRTDHQFLVLRARESADTTSR
ncbi:MAG: hypothetical protein MUD17_05195 [Gemmatimonadaceae bacterium]|nr:hypothetical protein [Gemmatimonadaceae bacterium]